MAQRKKRARRTVVGTEKKEVASPQAVAPPKPNPAISTLEEAISLVEESFKTPLVLEYIVLENKTVFYGINRGLAVKTAKKFGLKYFDVKLET